MTGLYILFLILTVVLDIVGFGCIIFAFIRKKHVEHKALSKISFGSATVKKNKAARKAKRFRTKWILIGLAPITASLFTLMGAIQFYSISNGINSVLGSIGYITSQPKCTCTIKCTYESRDPKCELCNLVDTVFPDDCDGESPEKHWNHEDYVVQVQRASDGSGDWEDIPGIGGGNGIPGHATGKYAVQLDDGSYYFYHQDGGKGCNCVYCGNWSSMTWGTTGNQTKFGIGGCAVYSLAMGISNLTGREITPVAILETLGSSINTKSNGRLECINSSAAFNIRDIKRANAIDILANTYPIRYENVKPTVADFDRVLSSGGYIWASWWDAKCDWCNSTAEGKSHFMVLRKMSDTSYYCFTSCRGRKSNGVGGVDGVIATMNAPIAKQEVVDALRNPSMCYGIWSTQQSSGGGGTGGAVNEQVYQILLANGYKSKAKAMAAAYQASLDAGFGKNFGIGLMANICAEGNYGQLEYKNSASYWSKAPQSILNLAGKVITNSEMARIWLTETPRVSGFGVGSIQWSSPSRRDGILNDYLQNARTYSYDELGVIEVNYMISEFQGSYSPVVKAAAGKGPGECASIICKRYEIPKNASAQAAKRAAVAENLAKLLANV